MSDRLPTVLARIVARTARDVAARRAEKGPLPDLARSTRGLAGALAAPGPRFVLECKRASPSGRRDADVADGVSSRPIRPALDPAALARDYAGAGADAMSVLTDAPFFRGGHGDLEAASAACTLPMLCKDFVLEPWQVREARAHQADAVLLMLSVLDDAAWAACAAQASDLALDALTEVHDEAELARALALGARVIGVNNRDLHTLTISLETTRALAPQVPADRLVVCESGVQSRADVRALAPLVDAFLVGTAVVGAPSPPRKARELIVGELKICGLTDEADVRAAWDAGASYAGFVLAPSSRRVTPERAARLRAAAPEMLAVGVFVDEDPARIAAAVAEIGLDVVQLHGDEDDATCAAVRAALPAGVRLWRALRVTGDSAARASDERAIRAALASCDRALLDARVAGAQGGSGHRFDWALVRALPADLRDRVVLAGGIDATNAAEADGLGCAALDVSSGVEHSPGRKDTRAMAALTAALRQAPGARADTAPTDTTRDAR